MNTVLTLHNPETARRYYIDGLWRRDTLYSLLADRARQRPSAIAVRDASCSLDWRTLQRWVDALAAELGAAGVRRGDRVSVWLPDRVEALVAFLACSRNGHVYNPLDRGYTVAEALSIVARVGAAALVVQRGHGSDGATAEVVAAAKALPSMKRVYCVPPPETAPRSGDVPFPSPSDPASGAAPDENPDKIVHLAFTSGTTGIPKGAMHSDNTLLSNGRALVLDWRHDHDTVLLNLAPLSHHLGTVAIEQLLAAGLTLVTPDLPPGVTLVDRIVQTCATRVMGFPRHALDILAELRRRGLGRLGSVEAFYLAGAPIPPAVAEQLRSFGIVPRSVYGTTENGSHQHPLPTDDPAASAATCGHAARCYEVTLWDREDPDLAVAPGAIGEIGGRGPSLMLGYFGDQVATERSFNRFGWFMSGDLGVLDERGCLRVVGRKMDVDLRKGHGIHPAGIEESPR